MSLPSKGNCKETFFLFYWDIQHYHPGSAEKIDRLILDFFYEEEPAAGSNSGPYSWDVALYRLMRIIRCRLGSSICSGSKHDYEWARYHDSGISQSPPYIDWFWLEPHISMEAQQNPTAHVPEILAHVSVVYKENGGPDERTHFRKAWTGNMFLKEFSIVHQTPEWSVPIPVHLECLLKVGWQQTTALDKCRGSRKDTAGLYAGFRPCLREAKRYLAGISASADERFEFVLEESKIVEVGTVAIRFPLEGLRHCLQHRDSGLNRLPSNTGDELLRVEDAKLHFIGMLYWAQQMALIGQTLPLPEFIDKQYEELAAVNDDGADRDEMKLDRMLWNALRSFGLERVKLNCKSCVETISSPPAM